MYKEDIYERQFVGCRYLRSNGPFTKNCIQNHRRYPPPFEEPVDMVARL